MYHCLSQCDAQKLKKAGFEAGPYEHALEFGRAYYFDEDVYVIGGKAAAQIQSPHRAQLAETGFWLPSDSHLWYWLQLHHIDTTLQWDHQEEAFHVTGIDHTSGENTMGVILTCFMPCISWYIKSANPPCGAIRRPVICDWKSYQKAARPLSLSIWIRPSGNCFIGKEGNPMRYSNKSFWRKIMPVDWSYTTKLAIPECINALINEEGTFGGNPLNLHTYRCVRYSENQLHIIFHGPQFGKARHTEYMIFFTRGNGVTRIDFHFQHELLRCPPFTSVQELDMFMSEKVNASRII